MPLSPACRYRIRKIRLRVCQHEYYIVEDLAVGLIVSPKLPKLDEAKAHRKSLMLGDWMSRIR